MIDHLGITVSDFARSKRFYEQALAPLGYGVLMDFPTPGGHIAGMGELASKKPDFWFITGDVKSTNHIAFAAQSRAMVEAFYRAAIAAGGRDNGGPGIRADYHPHYFAAFVYDPDGHNIEAVCHTPEG